MLLSANADIRKAEYLKELGYDGIDVGLCLVIYNNDRLRIISGIDF